jgi:branched-chain amino acid transport system substrate-binding protein
MAVRDNIRRVSYSPDGRPIPWFDLAQGFKMIEEGSLVDYMGASGSVDFSTNGEVGTGLVQVWQIVGNKIEDGELVPAVPL